MGWKKLIVGEKMPDRNDPQYKERYEREVAAGRRFADVVGISWLSRKLQAWGQSHKVAFLVIVFGVVGLCLIYNVVYMVLVLNRGGARRAVAVECVDSALQHRFHSKDLN